MIVQRGHLPERAVLGALCLFMCATTMAAAPQPAFPGAEGFGAYAKGKCMAAKHFPVLPQAVGKLEPNPFGIYDMAGNVRDLVSDDASYMVQMIEQIAWPRPPQVSDRCLVSCSRDPSGKSDGSWVALEYVFSV